MGFGLSKSRIIAWRQCPKRLWLQVHRPDLLEISSADEQRFQIGFEIGEVARRLYPGGILIEEEDLSAAIEATNIALAEHPDQPVFEATFQRNGVLVRADVLLPEGSSYRMIEVKSSTSVKDYHLEDCAVQTWVMEVACPLAGVEVAHVDNQFVYPGEGDYRGLFNRVSVDEAVTSLMEQVPDWVLGARGTLAGSEPAIEPGCQCEVPFPCPFQDYCGANQTTTEYPLSVLPRLSLWRRDELEDLGIQDVRDIPPDFPLTASQARVLAVTRAGQAELSPDAAKALATLSYPRYYLDFETVSFAVPIWVGTRPYQAIPVQWSCHIESAPGGIKHLAFLAEGNADPRRYFVQALIMALGEDGPVFVYNQTFELRILRELAQAFPELAPALQAIADRIIDLLPLTRGHYYHPDMRGSWSIKAVLPTIAPDLSYNDLEIGEGGEAEGAWREILHPDTPGERKVALRQSLAEYCALDTWAMVRLAWFLERR